MKILLVGEYSNVHWTLAEGLRELGHEVVVASGGDGWKNYQRDINLQRRSLGTVDTLRYLWQLRRIMPRLRDFDVVQLINPVFLNLRAERILPYYEQLRRQNGRLFLGSFGIDKPWVEEGLKPDTFRYSDFYMNGQQRHNAFTQEMQENWLQGAKGTLFDHVAEDCDGIIAGLYENFRCCQPRYGHKLHFIPFPINMSHTSPKVPHPDDPRLRFFVGVQRHRSEYKGTDIMLRALERLQQRYPTQMKVEVAESVPFPVYQQMMNTSDVLLDQLYSYTPAMNGLLAMSKGIILVGGAEPEHYELLGERELHPIVNVLPSEEQVVEEIERTLLKAHPSDIAQRSLDSVEYVRRHHDHVRVAQQFIDCWTR